MKNYQMISIDKLIPYAKNSKMHSDESIERIKKSIETFGFNQPIVINHEYKICVGHGRYHAAKLLGLKEVPILKKKFSLKEFRAYNVADNKTNEFAEWDQIALVEVFRYLDESDEIDAIGFSKEEIDLIFESKPEMSQPVAPNDTPFGPPDTSDLVKWTLTFSKGELKDLKKMVEEIRLEPVSYTHLTLPTTPYV